MNQYNIEDLHTGVVITVMRISKHYEHMLRQRQEEENEQTASIQNEQPNKQTKTSSNRNDLKMTWLCNMSLL